MRAEFVDQSGLAFGVAERKQLLAENLHPDLGTVGLGNFSRQQDRHPIAPHEVAHSGARPGPHQRFSHLVVHEGRTS